MTKKIVIVGAGISGLSVAWQLDKNKYQIVVVSREFFPDLTSNRAAAFWFPYHIRHDARGIQWARASYDFFISLAGKKGTGISRCPLIKVVPDHVMEQDDWINFMPEGSVSKMLSGDLPKGYSTGYKASVPLMETQIFLPWLQEQLVYSGVQFIKKEVTSLNLLQMDNDVVINCSGLGARTLCNDKSMIPVRGQVVLLEPGYPDEIFLDNHLPCYIVPRKDSTIVGGTYEENIGEAVTVDSDLNEILRKAFSVYPKLTVRKVIGSWAGLRPYREKIRLEMEAGTNIIHNYGHGGSGFTLSFGCAAEVAMLVEKCLSI